VVYQNWINLSQMTRGGILFTVQGTKVSLYINCRGLLD